MVFKPIKINIEGNEIEFMDGGIFCANDPTAIAIRKAQRLYPGRPLGVLIMSLDLGTKQQEDELPCRAIDIARQHHPNLHFHRLIPTKVLDKLSFRETDPEVIVHV